MTDRGDATKAKLIQAATAVVSEAGYAHATTKAIATAAGVSEGTIYRHFPDKTALFMAAILHSNADIAADLANLTQRAGTESVHENLVDALRMLVRLRDAVLPLELALRAEPDPVRRAAVEAHLTHGADLPGPPGALAAYLRAEQSRGRIRPDLNCEMAAMTLMASLLGLALLPGPDHLDRWDDAFIDNAVDVFLRGAQ